MTTEMSAGQTISVAVNNRAAITFVGRELVRVSTYTPGKPRWTELALFARDDGGYVFQRLGKSVTYHRPDCRKMFGRMDLELIEEPRHSDFPCEECDPDQDRSPVLMEPDKHYAVALDDASRVIDAVHERDRRTHEIRLSKLAQELLLVAAEQDVGIRTATSERMLRAASE